MFFIYKKIEKMFFRMKSMFFVCLKFFCKTESKFIISDYILLVQVSMFLVSLWRAILFCDLEVQTCLVFFYAFRNFLIWITLWTGFYLISFTFLKFCNNHFDQHIELKKKWQTERKYIISPYILLIKVSMFVVSLWRAILSCELRTCLVFFYAFQLLVFLWVFPFNIVYIFKVLRSPLLSTHHILQKM